MDTEQIRNEFKPLHGSRLALFLDALDMYRQRADEARGPYEDLRDKTNEAVALSRDGNADPLQAAQAETALPALRARRRRAQNAHERARGKARTQERDLMIHVKQLRQYRAELAELQAVEPKDGLSDNEWVGHGYKVYESDEKQRAQRIEHLENYLATWLEPDASVQRRAIARELDKQAA